MTVLLERSGSSATPAPESVDAESRSMPLSVVPAPKTRTLAPPETLITPGSHASARFFPAPAGWMPIFPRCGDGLCQSGAAPVQDMVVREDAACLAAAKHAAFAGFIR